MKGFSMLAGTQQIVLTGVEGAGRKSFASLYFPKMEQKVKCIRRLKRAKEIIVVAILDCIHLQNLAEEAMLTVLTKARKHWKQMPVKILLVLGKIDLVCNSRQNRKWIEEVMQGYKKYLQKLHATRTAIVAHSYLAVAKFSELQSGKVEDEDVDDIAYLLSRCGHRLPRSVSKDNLRQYLAAHRTTAQMLSGEFFVREFIKDTKKKRS